MTSPAVWARIAGLLYLFVIAAGVFALITTQSLIVRGDAATTAANILAAEPAFRLAFAANLLANVAYIAVVAILYVLMKAAGPTLSAIAALMGLAGCAVSGATMVSQLTGLAYLGDAGYVAVFSQAQLQALARASLHQGAIGYTLGLVFFGFYCLLLGSLVFRARFLPRVLGLPLVLAGAGWLVGSFGVLLAPSLPLLGYLVPVSGLGEGLFTLWLFVMGVNPAKWREQAAAAEARA